MLVTVTLKAVSVGTELNVEQSGIPDVIPLDACYLGWQDSLRHLADLVEPNIDFLRSTAYHGLPKRSRLVSSAIGRRRGRPSLRVG